MIDIVFAVDVSCGITPEECENQQEMIADIFSVIRGPDTGELIGMQQTMKVRVAYIEFGSDSVTVLVDFASNPRDHPDTTNTGKRSYNSGSVLRTDSDNGGPDSLPDLNGRYHSWIRDRADTICTPANLAARNGSPNLFDALYKIMIGGDSLFDDADTQNLQRDPEILIFSNCKVTDDEREEICERYEDEIRNPEGTITGRDNGINVNMINTPPTGSTRSGVVEILAGEDICFRAHGYHVNNNFNPPIDGEIYGIRLVHKSGSVTCKPSSAPTNWGCEDTVLDGDVFGVQMVEVGGTTYYPTEVTDGVGNYYDSVAGCTTECAVEWYKLNQGLNDDEILLVDGDMTYPVTTSQIFNLQYGEGCCDESTADNSGESCADVYFLYNITTNSSLPKDALTDEDCDEYLSCLTEYDPDKRIFCNEPCKNGTTTTTGGDYNLQFIVDESGSVTSPNYLMTLDFIETLVNTAINPYPTLLSFFSFSDDVHEQHSFDDEQNDNRAAFIASLGDSFTGGRTSTGEAMEAGVNDFISSSSVSASDDNIIILLTDGRANEGFLPCDGSADALALAADIASYGIRVITVAIGNFDQTTISCLSTAADTFTIANFNETEFQKLEKELEEEIFICNDPYDPDVLDFVEDSVCDEPTPAPTMDPTSDPTQDPTTPPPTEEPRGDCEIDFELDIVFIVDTSCEITQEECENQQDMIAAVFETIRGPDLGTTITGDPGQETMKVRVAYLEMNSTGYNRLVEFRDNPKDTPDTINTGKNSYNGGQVLLLTSDNGNVVDTLDQVNDRYAEWILGRKSAVCDPAALAKRSGSPNLFDALHQTMIGDGSIFDEGDSNNKQRDREILIFSNCQVTPDEREEICDRFEDEIRNPAATQNGRDNGINVNMINTPPDDSTVTDALTDEDCDEYLSCLTEYDPDKRIFCNDPCKNGTTITSGDYNLQFIVDESGSVTSPNYLMTTNFIETLVTNGVINPYPTLLSFFSFATDVYEQYSFDDPQNDGRVGFKNSLGDSFTGGRTSTGEAMQAGVNDFISSSSVSSTDDNIIILLTDGRANEGFLPCDGSADALALAADIASYGIRVITVAIGNFDQTTISCLSTAADTFEIEFTEQDFEDLEKELEETIFVCNDPYDPAVLDFVEQGICECEPTPAPTSDPTADPTADPVEDEYYAVGDESSVIDNGLRRLTSQDQSKSVLTNLYNTSTATNTHLILSVFTSILLLIGAFLCGYNCCCVKRNKNKEDGYIKNKLQEEEVEDDDSSDDSDSSDATDEEQLVE